MLCGNYYLHFAYLMLLRIPDLYSLMLSYFLVLINSLYSKLMGNYHIKKFLKLI